jgi:intracellular multiplication protein IcmD
MNKKTVKKVVVFVGAVAALGVSALALAGAAAASGAPATQGIAVIATNVKGNLGAIAQLITAGSYVAGMGFAVGAVVKFKAHKDNPTQIAIGMPIALLFIAAALMFIPSVFKTSGQTLFGASGTVGGIGGVTSFSTT